MRAPPLRCADWLDLAASLPRSRARRSQGAKRPDHLGDTFDRMISFNGLDAEGRGGFEPCEPITGFPAADKSVRLSLASLAEHPVLLRGAATPHPVPKRSGRTPLVAVPRAFDHLNEVADQSGQSRIPCSRHGNG